MVSLIFFLFNELTATTTTCGTGYCTTESNLISVVQEGEEEIIKERLVYAPDTGRKWAHLSSSSSSSSTTSKRDV